MAMLLTTPSTSSFSVVLPDEQATQRRLERGYFAVLKRILPRTHSGDFGGAHTLTDPTGFMSSVCILTLKSRAL